MNVVTTDIATDHNDFIMDICYDLHGRRLATCSADKVLKVWTRSNNIQSQQPEWKLEATLNDAGTKVDWAHPEFGSILATSHEQSILVWEEMVQSSSSTGNANTGAMQSPAMMMDGGGDHTGSSLTSHMKEGGLIASSSSQSSTSTSASASSLSPGFGKRWNLAAKITQTKGSGSVKSIKFAPRHLGLLLAACTDDGFVRIYRATDVTSLAVWNQEHEFEVSPHSQGLGKSQPVTCISWNPSPLDGATMLVLGTGHGHVMIWRLDNKLRKWTKIIDLTDDRSIKDDSMKKMASSSSDAELYRGITVEDVSWAPNMGRSFHLIASASLNGAITIWKLVFSPNAGKDGNPIESLTVESLRHGSEAWKVEWNVTGTILATSGDDGIVRLWRSEYAPSLASSVSSSAGSSKTWKCFNEIT